jgi:hypothetical protein
MASKGKSEPLPLVQGMSVKTVKRERKRVRLNGEA